MSEYVEVTVKVGGEVVDTHLFGPGEEIEREAFETGIAVVGRRVLPVIVGYESQYHDHDTEQQSCTCESRHLASWWTNGLPERWIAGGEDTLAELQRIIDARKQH